MHVVKYENSRGVAYVYYNKLPSQKGLEEACSLFMKQVIREREEKERKKDEKRA